MSMSLNHEAAGRADLIVYADGACSGNPGPGGYAYRIETPDGQCAGATFFEGQSPLEASGGSAMTTNNIMELQALLSALEALAALGTQLTLMHRGKTDVALRLDSEYVLRGLFEWLPAWKARGWRTAAKKPVKNAEIWEKIDATASSLSDIGVTLVPDWVKGHSGEAGNELVDRMAVEARDAARAGAEDQARAEHKAAVSLSGDAPSSAPDAPTTARGPETAPDTPASDAALKALSALANAHANGVIDTAELHAKLKARAGELGLV